MNEEKAYCFVFQVKIFEDEDTRNLLSEFMDIGKSLVLRIDEERVSQEVFVKMITQIKKEQFKEEKTRGLLQKMIAVIKRAKDSEIFLADCDGIFEYYSLEWYVWMMINYFRTFLKEVFLSILPSLLVCYDLSCQNEEFKLEELKEILSRKIKEDLSESKSPKYSKDFESDKILYFTFNLLKCLRELTKDDNFF